MKQYVEGGRRRKEGRAWMLLQAKPRYFIGWRDCGVHGWRIKDLGRELVIVSRHRKHGKSSKLETA